MDLPLEALKIVSEAAPTQDGSNHNLIWTPENGFVLSISVGGQFQPIRFDYGDTINEIKEEIQMVTGIPMPEQKKPHKKEKSMDKEASKTPLLDGIKEAVLGGDNLGSISGRQSAQQEALNAALGTGGSAAPVAAAVTPTRTSRPGFLSRISDFRRSVLENQ